MTDKDLIKSIISIIDSTNNSYAEDCAYAYEDICYVVKKYLEDKNEKYEFRKNKQIY